MENQNSQEQSQQAVQTQEAQPVQENSSIKRPWQGTLLAILSIISLMACVGVIVLVLIGGSLFASQAGAEALGVFGVLGGLAALILAPFIILNILLIVGMFKGWKWVIIVMIIFAVLGILSGIFSLPGGILGLIFSGLFLWLEIICLRHPFYN